MYATRAQSSRTRYTQASDSLDKPPPKNPNGDFTPNIWWDTPVSRRGVNAWT